MELILTYLAVMENRFESDQLLIDSQKSEWNNKLQTNYTKKAYQIRSIVTEPSEEMNEVSIRMRKVTEVNTKEVSVTHPFQARSSFYTARDNQLQLSSKVHKGLLTFLI